MKHIKELPTGIYNVPMDVTDLQGFGTRQTVAVRICQCINEACLDKESSVSLGGLALLAMLLPLALLLLLCEYPTAILLPADLCRLHCVCNETGVLCSCMCREVQGHDGKFKMQLSLNYALHVVHYVTNMLPLVMPTTHGAVFIRNMHSLCSHF